MLDFSI
jgi:hypothetical protein